MVERLEPILARIDLEGDVIEAGGLALGGVGQDDARLPRVLGQFEENDVVMLVVDAHEADRPAEVRRPPAPGQLEAQHLAIEREGAVDVADVNADVPDAIETNSHAHSPLTHGHDPAHQGCKNELAEMAVKVLAFMRFAPYGTSAAMTCRI